MRYVLSCAILFLSTIVLAQQQGQPPPTTSPPNQTPPTFPEERQAPREQTPAPQAPPPQTMSNQQVEGQILERLRAEPSLAATNVDVKVDENSVVLTGSVDTVAQHDLAIRIAQANAGDRNVVDEMKIKQQT
jgi:glucose/arabinose dehydrogenase